MPKQDTDGELDHVVVAAWEEIEAKQDAWVNSSPCDMEVISPVLSGPKRAQLCLKMLTTNERRQKGAPTSWCARYSSNKLASFSLKKYGSDKAKRPDLERTRRMQWMYGTHVTQDAEAFEFSDAHFASYFHAADWEAFLFYFACQRQC